MAPELVPVVDGGLGNTTWMVDLGDGRALVVDASRDLRAVQAAADKRGLTVAYAADTHLHADFLTGAVQAGRRRGRAGARLGRRAPRVPAPRAGRRRRGRPGRADAAGAGHARAHRRARVLPAGRRPDAGRGVHRRLADRRRRRPHRPGRSRPHRGAGPRPVRVAAPAGHPARRGGRVAHPRRRLVLLGPARRGAQQHHRSGVGDQPAAGRRRRGRLRRPAARQPRLLPGVLPPAR